MRAPNTPCATGTPRPRSGFVGSSAPGKREMPFRIPCVSDAATKLQHAVRGRTSSSAVGMSGLAPRERWQDLDHSVGGEPDRLVRPLADGLAVDQEGRPVQHEPQSLRALDALAELQATTEDAAIDAEPGKSVHEVRHGKAARHWFARYYGTADATPLFLVLLGVFGWLAFVVASVLLGIVVGLGLAWLSSLIGIPMPPPPGPMRQEMTWPRSGVLLIWPSPGGR